MITDPRGFSVVLFLVLVAICAYLLFNRTLAGAAFALSIVASAIAVVLVVNADRLDQLVFRQGDNEATVQLRQLREDVYAKVEQLQRIAQGVAAFTADSIAREGRFPSEDRNERTLRRRDELLKFLTEAGVSAERSAEIVAPITLMVDWDFRKAIEGNARASWRLKAGEDPMDPSAREAAMAEIAQALQLPDRLAAIAEVERLFAGPYAERIRMEPYMAEIHTYRAFIEKGWLPRYGPTDDLAKPPIQ